MRQKLCFKMHTFIRSCIDALVVLQERRGNISCRCCVCDTFLRTSPALNLREAYVMKFIVVDNPKFWAPILRKMFKIKKVKEE